MNNAREVAVLFADVSDSTKLYESEGDRAAMEAIAVCVDQMQRHVESSGGRIVKTIGDEVMAVFPTADTAAAAAGDMQCAIDGLPPVGGTKLGIGVGFQWGPVIQSADDVFGDTVNLAARLTQQAGRGQIITSSETADRLGPIFGSFKRPLYAIHVKGKAEGVELCELIWREVDDVTMSSAHRAVAKPVPLVLRLKYNDREMVYRRHNEVITIGRDPACVFVVVNASTSRHHCTIERRRERFILADQSTNGTYVTAEGNAEIILKREELLLGKHGWITFGQPRAEAKDIVEYFCD